MSSNLFFLFFTLNLFFDVKNAYPTISSDTESIKNDLTMLTSNMTLITPICVYASPNLKPCKFISENFRKSEHKIAENEKHELSENNKINFTSMHVPITNKIQRQPFVKTVIYEIQRCMPPRLPFILPWCTDEDLSDKTNEIYQIYPFK